MAVPTPTREIAYDEFMQHTKRDNLYILLHNKVHDVSKFIDEHPGGEEVMFAEAGKDATEAFEDVGHSDEAREIVSKLCIGELEKNSAIELKAVQSRPGAFQHELPNQSQSVMSYVIPLALLTAYFAWRFYS